MNFRGCAPRLCPGTAGGLVRPSLKQLVPVLLHYSGYAPGDKQLVHITVVLRSKNIFSSLVTFKFILHIIFFDFNFCGPELAAEYSRN